MLSYCPGVLTGCIAGSLQLYWKRAEQDARPGIPAACNMLESTTSALARCAGPAFSAVTASTPSGSHSLTGTKGAQGLRCSDQVLRHCGLIIANSKAQSVQEHL